MENKLHGKLLPNPAKKAEQRSKMTIEYSTQCIYQTIHAPKAAT